MADQLVFGYWGIRGLAQPLRYFLEYLGLPYEEKRYFKPEEWFGEVSQPPLNQEILVNLPYIKDGNRWFFESQALYVYLAHKANRQDLLGITPDEQVTLAQTKGVIQDILKVFFTLITLPEDQYETKKEEFFKTEVVWLIEKLNKFIGGRQWAAGNNITYVDFLLFEVEETLKVFTKDNDFFNSQENLKTHHQNFANLPQIKAYLASEKFIAGPFYPPGRFRWN